MSKHLKRDLDRIEKSILEIGALVEQSIVKAISVLTTKQVDLTHEVLADDERIDRLEVELEENCLKALALHQPVAVDLRFIIAVIKVNSTLERMGDHACNIARGALGLAEIQAQHGQIDIGEMAELVRRMVRDSLNALVQLDVQQAQDVLNADDLVDNHKNQVYQETIKLLNEGVGEPRNAVNMLLVSRNLERIADLATNIAEDVIFMVDGEIVRHQGTAELAD